LFKRNKMKTQLLFQITFFVFISFSGFSQDFSIVEKNESTGGNLIQSVWLEPTFQSKNDPTVQNKVGKHKRLEVGFKIPSNTTVQINRFLNGGNGINPFDPTQIDFKVILTDPNGNKMTRYAFYYKPFITDLEKDVFIEDTTDFVWRFRFAPPILGKWKIALELIVGSSKINEEALTFECVESNQKGTLQTTNTGENSDRWLKFSETNQPFFAISNNISSGGFYGYIPSQNRRQMDGVQQLIDAKGNFTRFELSAQGPLPDWPIYNNYKSKFDEMYAFDQLVNLCEDNDVYFTLFRHHVEVLDGGHPGQPNWDGVSWYENPYRQAFKIENMEDYFTKEEIIKWQNNSLRYVFSRWGYSPNMAFYSYSEVDRWYSKIFEDQEQTKVTGNKAVDGGVLNEEESIEMLAKWIENQQRFIRNNLSDSILFCHTYARTSKKENSTKFKGFFAISDAIGVHNYEEVKNVNFKKRYDQLNQWWDVYHKPVIMEEMGVNKIPILCCTGIEYHNNIWSTAFMGDFGTGMDWWWDRGVHDFGYQAELMNIQYFFASEDLKLGNYSPQKWDDVSSFNIPDAAIRNRLIENFALKSSTDERVLGWVHNASYYWRNLANDVPCIQELVISNKLSEPCIVARNFNYKAKNKNEINGAPLSEYHDISKENHSDFNNNRYKDRYTDKGGAKEIKAAGGFLKNPTFTVSSLKKSTGLKKNWYKIEFYYTHGSNLDVVSEFTQILHTEVDGDLKPHVPNLTDTNPDFAYKISFIGKHKKKAEILKVK
jgi:hypothetical protein